MMGGEDEDLFDEMEEDGKSFFYQKWYDVTLARFEDVPASCHDPVPTTSSNKCIACYRKKEREKVRNRTITHVCNLHV